MSTLPVPHSWPNLSTTLLMSSVAFAVTTCNRATKALSLLREDRNYFDLVISDVYMPDMDGFKLLEAIGLELDLPVISKPLRLCLLHLFAESCVVSALC